MPYLVDGNNVMAQRVGWHKDKPAARRRLMNEAAELMRSRRVSVTIVFDGAPEQHFADGSTYRGVRLFYAARGSNADERIKELAEHSRERKTLVVVTSDRALAAYVRALGAQVMRSGDFRRRLDEAAKGREDAPEENDTVAEEDMPDWMRYFGVGPEDEE